MIEIKAPNSVNEASLFLAGSIEMDTAENWQTKVVKSLENYDVTIYNPRRDNFDPEMEQSIDNEQFFEQVNWELDCINNVNLVVMYFDPKTKSPISLMELGLLANTRKVIVCCPEGFWRKGNVDIVCYKYNIPICDSLEELIETVQSSLVYWKTNEN